MSLIALTEQAYFEASKLLEDASMSSVVNSGLNILYGPPIERPDIAFVTFQGGGADNIIQTSWPERLLYLDDPYKFGRSLRSICSEVGLSEKLESSSVALPCVFPQSPTSDANKWMSQNGPRADWTKFSLKWVHALLKAMKPKTIVVFGSKASRLLSIDWLESEFNHSQNHQTFGVSEFLGAQAFYCHHLSIGCPRSEAIKCMESVRKALEQND